MLGPGTEEEDGVNYSCDHLRLARAQSKSKVHHAVVTAARG